ncbi:NAD(P)-dependent dehydrogenase (short-subunit alcohol dehydrogenase family) [Actinocorallia herbida]|uniref:NAD(P)-dependent dehydrogenase (Short-subunit alcohol dehydrogenase family) n=1 Tax=Actinocorallia herbida TaxID=58109 RepID=A0A3N1D2X4_9ACTN|nr:SDR family oxidoreductase [Actinocorallia herbida]ROO87840.1 NAD(P)-dependent dehydrogenase (short-subunit alcohol dehydrogenase family) [Actinocorallia herbida]
MSDHRDAGTSPFSGFDLTGRTALITGATRGLGLAIARAFAGAGADIVVSSRKEDACTATAEELRADHGVKAWAMPCNVSSWDQCTELAHRAEQVTGGIDVLVNNAGLSPLYPSLGEITEALYDKVIGINVKGPFRLAALIGEAMVARGRGSIINVTSIESDHPSVYALPYAAAKAALANTTIGLSRALGPHVRVNTISPGPFLTDISKAWDMAKFNAAADQAISMRRAGEPGEIVGAALYLASDASSYTTGATIRVDGGVFGTLG